MRDLPAVLYARAVSLASAPTPASVAAPGARTPVGALALFALVAAFGALMFLGLAAYDTFVRLQRDRDTRYRASMSLVGLTALLAHMADAETGQRGYLLTGRADYLDPYEEGRAAIGFDIAAMHRERRMESPCRVGWG